MAIDPERIEAEIDRLESKETSYYVCSRLSMLYTVLDHVRPRSEDGRTPEMRGSEFLELSSGVSYRALMKVLDEHMSAMAVVQPKQYAAVLDKIRGLK